jgi:glycosyltransferase involved in cell wall biosynthesis
LTQLEAQAHRLPIIASQNCGEVVRDGVNGLLLSDPSVENISRALQVCLSPQQLAAFSEASLRSEKFGIEALKQNLQAIQFETRDVE